MNLRHTDWILASASPRRREILAGLGLKFKVRPSAGSEPTCRNAESPLRYAMRAARLKALEVAGGLDGGVVIGADTVVVSRGRLLGKPVSRAEARSMLAALSGRWHDVITGICLVDCRRKRSVSSCAVSRVHFRRLSAGEVRWYLDAGEYADKAGAYAIQGLASLFIDRIEGCYFNIVGFPVFTFEKLCRRLKIRLIGKRPPPKHQGTRM
jgi:septum formation protein